MIRYVDFDGVLARLDDWKGPKFLGEPVPEMIRKIKEFLSKGDKVVIFTARLTRDKVYNQISPKQAKKLIQAYCLKHIGVKLPVTNKKGIFDVAYDDKFRRIVQNTGLTEAEYIARILKSELKSKRDKKSSLKKVLEEVNKLIEE